MTIFRSTYPDVNIPKDLSYTDFVFQNFHSYGDKVAIVDATSDQQFTYKQIQQYTFAFAKNLQSQLNFRHGDVFGVLLPNLPWYAVIFHGISSTGGASSTINPIYTVEEIHKQLVDSRARFLVTIPMFLENAIGAVPNTKVEKIFILSPDKVKEEGKVYDFKRLLAPPKDNKPLNVKVNPLEDPVVIPYSSGTTGLSKGVVLTHYNLIANILQIQATEPKPDPNDVDSGILPYFHCYGMLIMNYGLFRGVKMVNFSKFDFVVFLQSVQKFKITHAALVPPIILGLAKEPVVDKFDLSSLKALISGAAPLGPQLTELAMNRLKCPIKQGYGMTELSPSVSGTPDHNVKPGFCGLLLPNVECKVLSTEDGQGKRKLLGPNEEGEICFRGPMVMKGYLMNEKATKETIIDGWLHSGDTGFVDEQGWLKVVDRVKELIKYKGFQVPPAELEALLLKHESVADCAVIGVPDEEAGEIPKAFVVKKKQDLTADDVMNYVSEHVNSRKKVRMVEFIDVIPKSATGKILRRMLRDRPATQSKL
ncbi:4-coumarate-CoA ligase [Acrasis kona]|uniref:4-coumarate-CoA ligase n=1 Tax=Acrasis kona TaxID=1008807 RepID=A0AAW2ZA60_9EUKA